jgi:hypothetical protein
MARRWRQNFSADAAPGWESSGSFRVTGWRSGATDFLDPDYPDVKLAEEMQVTLGTGPNGENVVESYGADGWSDSGIEFGSIGILSGGDMDTSKPIRIKCSVYFDPVAMNDGYATLLSVYTRNVTSGYINAGPSMLVTLYEVAGDTWGVELNIDRWGTTDYNPTSYTFSRAATEGQWHEFELTIVHCTVNDYSTDDFESDGLVRFKWNGVTIYEQLNEPFKLWVFTADKIEYGRAASIAYGFYSLIGPATNFEYHDSLSEPITGSIAAGSRTRVDVSRGIAFGVDGNENTLSEEGVVQVFGQLKSTEDITGIRSADLISENYAKGIGAIPGKAVAAGRNSSGSGAAGYYTFTERDGTLRYAWFEAGVLRVHTSPPTEDNTTVSHTAGSAVGSGASAALTFLTDGDETASLANSRRVLAGTGITFDDTTPGERTINAAAAQPKSITWCIDGAGSVISVGAKVGAAFRAKVAGTITKITLMADQNGAIVIDIWKDTFANYPPTNADSITASAPPTIPSSNISAEDSTLTGWTTGFSAGDVFIINVDSVTAITRCTLMVEYT